MDSTTPTSTVLPTDVTSKSQKIRQEEESRRTQSME